MKQQQVLLKISELLSRFKVQVGILNASSMLDINIIAEDFLIPILDEIYNSHLINANTITKNFPALDLIDKANRISFQITSTSKPKKIRETLEKIVTYNYYDDYDIFYILIITEKAEKYDVTMLNNATAGKLIFTNDNIIDIETLFIKIKSLSLNKIQKISDFLEMQYSSEKTNEIIENHLPKVINLLSNNFDEKYLATRLESAYQARQEWYEKVSFIQINSASIFDLNQKFSIEKSLKECRKKIEHYETEIATLLNIINKRYE